MEEERFDRLDKKVDGLSETVTVLGKKVDQTADNVTALSEKVDDLSDTVAILGKKVDQTSDTVTALSKKVDQTTDNVTALSETLTEFIEFVKDNVVMKSDLTKSEHNMKVYIDDKFADQKGELILQSKFNVELIDGLKSNKVFEADRIGRLKALTVNTASK